MRTLLFTALVALALSGCAGSRQSSPNDEMQRSPSVESDDATAEADLESLYWSRRQGAMTSFTEADVEFMTGMISHHAQALVMSNLVPTHGASNQVRILASRIINAQRDEIATMQQWLRDRDQPVPEVHIDGLELTMTMEGEDHAAGMEDDAGHGMSHDMEGHMNMPGMLTPEQLRELDAARGEEFDILFLRYMIQHHSGAITMVDKLFGVDGAAEDEASFKLASDINVDQITEIKRMQLMLDARTEPGRDP